MLLDGNGYRSHAGEDSRKGTYAIPAEQPRSYLFGSLVRGSGEDSVEEAGTGNHKLSSIRNQSSGSAESADSRAEKHLHAGSRAAQATSTGSST